MDDADAFLRAVLDDPEADAPRLVYADWLDERGGPGDPARAEFIRAQVEAERWPDSTPRARELREHANALQTQFDYGDRPDIGSGLDDWAAAVTYRRGFVEAVELDAARFFADPRRVFRHAPVRFVSLTNVTTTSLAALITCQPLTALRALSLQCPAELADALTRSVTLCPHLSRLEELRLACPRCDPAALNLRQAVALGSLEVLDVREGGLSAATADALRTTSALPRLTMLFV